MYGNFVVRYILIKGYYYITMYLPPIEVVVEFDPTMYSVTEGMMAQLTIVLRSQSAVPVTVDIETVDGTANCKWVWPISVTHSDLR